MTFTESINNCYGNYFNFSGRASRSEYWWFYLFNILVSFVYCILFLFLAGGAIIAAMAGGDLSAAFSGSIPLVLLSVIYKIYCIGTIIPGLAVTFRRLHDTGRSAWNIFFVLIPLVGPIVLLVFLCSASDDENSYGYPDY